MKIVVFLLLVVAAAVFFWEQQKSKGEASADAPEVIANPVYSETRVKISLPAREVEGVMLMEAADEADCQKQVQIVEKQVRGEGLAACKDCKLEGSECKAELPSRESVLFDNKPTFVTYLRLARGAPAERETRLIWWGVTVNESNQICAVVAAQQKGRRGATACISAAAQ